MDCGIFVVIMRTTNDRNFRDGRRKDRKQFLACRCAYPIDYWCHCNRTPREKNERESWQGVRKVCSSSPNGKQSEILDFRALPYGGQSAACPPSRSVRWCMVVRVASLLCPPDGAR